MSQRINFRLLLLMGIVVFVVGWVLWKFVETSVTGGIINRGQYLEVDLKEISSFEMDQYDATDESIPDRFRKLDGKRVLLVGEMYQAYAIGGNVAQFALVYSIAKCCVTSSPKIQHFVKSTADPARSIAYHDGLVKVMGIFHVGVEKVGGRVRGVYRVDVQSVEPVSLRGPGG